MTENESLQLFQETEDEPLFEDKNYFQELVGEGKKYKDEVAAGKALMEKDWHISRIQRENAELRQQSQAGIKMKEFLDRLDSLSTQNSNSNAALPGEHEEDTTDTPAFTAEDLDKLLSERELRAKRTNNLKEVKEVLTDQLGPNYTSKVKAIAEDLGYSDEEMQSLAASNPKAFYRLIGIGKPKERFQSPVSTSVNTTGFRPSVNTRNYSYYRELMKTQPGGYLPANLYAQMEKDAFEQGQAFFGS